MAHVVGAVERQVGIGAENFPAVHRAAENHGVAAPRVVGAAAVRAQRASEIRRGKSDRVVREAEQFQRLLIRAERGVHAGQHPGLGVEQFAVMIPAAVVDKKSLALQAEQRTDLNHLHHGLERGGEIIVRRKQRVRRRTEGGAGRIELRLKQQLRAITLFGDLRKTFREQVRIVLIERAAQAGIFQLERIAIRAAGVALERQRAGRRDDKLLRGVADLKNIIAAERNAHRSRAGVVEAVQHIRATPGPAAQLCQALRHGGLPLLDLVAVREQRLRHGQREIISVFPIVELRLRDGLDERADVADEREPLLAGEHARAVRHLLQIRARRMQRKIIRGCGEREQGIAIQREAAVAAVSAARDGIGVVARLFVRHEQVERVAAAAEKQADERLVVERQALRGDGVGEAQVEQRVENRG